MNNETEKSPRRRGMPDYVPTQKDRDEVALLVGFGMTHREICVVKKNPRTGKPISVNTLEKVYKQELEAGKALVKQHVIGNLFRRATANHPSAVTAAIWFTKARFGWKSTDRFEHHHEGNTTGVLVAPVGRSPAEWVNQQSAKNKKRKAPASVDREAS